MSLRSRTTCSLLLTGVLLAGCAQGSGGGESQDANYDSEAELSGQLTVMGFGAGDEIATVRMEEAEAAMGDVEVELIEGDLDIQQLLSSVASGEPRRSSTPTATRSARSPRAARSSR